MNRMQIMDFPAYVITLRRAVNRQQQVQRIIDTCPVECSIVDAVDGSQLSADELSRVYHRRLHRPKYPFVLRPGEIGCFLSHRQIWQAMIENSLPMVLVVEDDIEFQLPAFEETLQTAAAEAQPGDYIQFQVRDLSLGPRVSNRPHDVRLVKPRVIPLRTSAQLVTLEAARRLVSASNRIDRPVDVFLQMKWVTGVNVLVAEPSNVIEVSANLGGSTIGASSRPMSDRLRHELLRPIYRGRIAFHSYRYAS